MYLKKCAVCCVCVYVFVFAADRCEFKRTQSISEEMNKRNASFVNKLLYYSKAVPYCEQSDKKKNEGNERERERRGLRTCVCVCARAIIKG